MEINELTQDEILNKEFFEQIYENYDDENERKEVLTEVYKRAKELKIVSKTKKLQQSYENELKLEAKKEIFNILIIGAGGHPEPTVENYSNILLKDDEICNHVRFNMMTNNLEWWENGKCSRWADYHDSRLLGYIEKEYGFYNDRKYFHAKDCLRDAFAYHPVREIIEEENWDEKPRIDRFLIDIMGCKDDEYAREVSRMIFYGGINRIYHPGCKFDYMPILMGSQGLGKSSIVNWLNLKQEFYKEVASIEGAKGVESIIGGWVCEFAELLAMLRAKEVESLKGYVSRQVDEYRLPYARNVSQFPRQCIFIGTTNDFQFLVDKTGNRRYLPIECKLKRGELYKHEAYVKEYILNCWREAKYLMDNGRTYLQIPREYDKIIERYQLLATDDDPKIGMIHNYLDSKKIGDKICGLDIFVNCCNGLKKNYTSKDGREISIIMRRFPEWQRMGTTLDFEQFGKQRYWEKVPEENIKEQELEMKVM